MNRGEKLVISTLGIFLATSVYVGNNFRDYEKNHKPASIVQEYKVSPEADYITQYKNILKEQQASDLLRMRNSPPRIVSVRLEDLD
jgi:hypothetical protein